MYSWCSLLASCWMRAGAVTDARMMMGDYVFNVKSYHPLWQNEAVGNTGARARAIVARTVNLRGFPPAVFRRNRGWGKGVGKDCSRYIRDRVKFELKSSQIQMRSRIRLLWGARRRERSGGRGATGMAGS